MMNEESLKTWEQENIELLTSREMGEWLYRRDMNAKPQGEWIAREDMDYLDENKVVHNHFQCNKCGLIHDFLDGHTSQYNFCPSCGAAMQNGCETE